MTEGLGAVKAGTVAAFLGISIVIGFLTDFIYFKRPVQWNEVLGACLIVVATVLQCVFSQLDNAKEAEERIRYL